MSARARTKRPLTSGMLAMKDQFPHLRNGRPWRQKDIADIVILRGLASEERADGHIGAA